MILAGGLLHRRVGPRFVFGYVGALTSLVSRGPMRTRDFALGFSRVCECMIARLSGRAIPMRRRVRFIGGCYRLRRVDSPRAVRVRVTRRLREYGSGALPLDVRVVMRGTVGRGYRAGRTPLSVSVCHRSRCIVMEGILGPVGDSLPAARGKLSGLHLHCDRLKGRLIIDGSGGCFRIGLPVLSGS